MSDLRTAAQQALEALEYEHRSPRGYGYELSVYEMRETSAAITALRAALAQQAEPLNLRDPAVQKRLATQWGYVPAAQQAEPVEPVAVVATQSDVWRGYNGQWAPPGEPIKMVQMLRDLPMGTPLFTAPPQRLPLTEEEIVDAVREADLDWQAGWTLDEHAPNRFTTLARAIERAHGIKE